ncbi:hypothetical protein KTQ42_12660|uniref:hypothetical protein n=1 Tax=Noviherbaspirillum sp. L7-7A TaxID=2850560 RepID=UPI001C2C368E|nr:hypothetical protein [Noviherbaspirillum sp. L7-7A]MBV0880153.1 hypothetical protein [Noviherbaspirillum sp. L7-7A]
MQPISLGCIHCIEKTKSPDDSGLFVFSFNYKLRTSHAGLQNSDVLSSVLKTADTLVFPMKSQRSGHIRSYTLQLLSMRVTE